MDGPTSAAGCQDSELLNKRGFEMDQDSIGLDFTGQDITVGEGSIWDGS